MTDMETWIPEQILIFRNSPSLDRTPEILKKALSGLSSRYDWLKVI